MDGTNKISDDAHLVRRLHKNDIFAFNELYQKYSAKAYNFISKHLDTEEDVKDLLQELFITIWKKRKDINEELSFNSYLFTITLNLIRKHFRKKIKDRNIIKKWIETPELYSSDPAYIAEFNDLENISIKIINELPPKRKQVFELSRKEGLSNDEIAVKLNINKKTVENHLNLALKYFRKKYKSSSFILSLFFIFYL